MVVEHCSGAISDVRYKPVRATELRHEAVAQDLKKKKKKRRNKRSGAKLL